MTTTPKPLVLIILDGFGHSESPEYNAIYAANKPVSTACAPPAAWPDLRLGMDVGLPDGQMGNSEVGHMNLGAGRVVYQDFTRVTKAIRDGEFFENPCSPAPWTRPWCRQGRAHPGPAVRWRRAQPPGPPGRHGRTGRQRGAEKIYLHAFLDGRDTPPKARSRPSNCSTPPSPSWARAASPA
jgi:2,3-bisphosphoglycerate-independent phosphoglycerate mutase